MPALTTGGSTRDAPALTPELRLRVTPAYSEKGIGKFASSSMIRGTLIGSSNSRGFPTRRTPAGKVSRRTIPSTCLHVTGITTGRRRAARASTTTRCAELGHVALPPLPAFTPTGPLTRRPPPRIYSSEQEQTPNHPGGGKPYPVDGECIEQCDCGTVNPCGEYIFDHRSTTVVDGQSFRDWFINDYMISNETVYHKDPVTGKPQLISLGWMCVA